MVTNGGYYLIVVQKSVSHKRQCQCTLIQFFNSRNLKKYVIPTKFTLFVK